MFGGDDLFGDLPSAKNDKKSQNVVSNHGKGKNPINKKRNAEQSLFVSALGSAGTTMAFVPTALQRRKRPQISPTPQKRVKQQQQQQQQQQPKINNQGQISDIHDLTSHVVPTKKTKDSIHLVDDKNKLDENVEEKEEGQKTSEGEQSFEESPEILALHAHVSTVLHVQEPHLIYDPHVPNDYLQFKEDESQRAYRAELEASAREALEVQRIMQEQVERERAAIERSGDLDQIVASRTSGRGRGRGVSNLPAWLVKKQEERQQKDSTPNDREQKQDNDPQHVVVVENVFIPKRGELMENFENDPDEEVQELLDKWIQRGCRGILRTQIQLLSGKLFIYFSKRDEALNAKRIFEDISNESNKMKAYILNE